MNAYSKWATMVLLAAGLATGSVAAYAAHDEGGDSGGHTDGKKGPKYMGGGNKGSSHSSASHKGGSKSTESKIFHGKSGGHDEASTEAGHEDGGTEHTH